MRAARAWITLGKHCLATIYWITGGFWRAGVGCSPRLCAGRRRPKRRQQGAPPSLRFSVIVPLDLTRYMLHSLWGNESLPWFVPSGEHLWVYLDDSVWKYERQFCLFASYTLHVVAFKVRLISCCDTLDERNIQEFIWFTFFYMLHCDFLFSWILNVKTPLIRIFWKYRTCIHVLYFWNISWSFTFVICEIFVAFNDVESVWYFFL